MPNQLSNFTKFAGTRPFHKKKRERIDPKSSFDRNTTKNYPQSDSLLSNLSKAVINMTYYGRNNIRLGRVPVTRANCTGVWN